MDKQAVIKEYLEGNESIVEAFRNYGEGIGSLMAEYQEFQKLMNSSISTARGIYECPKDFVEFQYKEIKKDLKDITIRIDNFLNNYGIIPENTTVQRMLNATLAEEDITRRCECIFGLMLELSNVVERECFEKITKFTVMAGNFMGICSEYFEDKYQRNLNKEEANHEDN